MDDYKYCNDCLIEFRDDYGKSFDFNLADNCSTCDDLIYETDDGRFYTNNRPGRERVTIVSPKSFEDHMRSLRAENISLEREIDKQTAKIEDGLMKLEKQMAYLDRFDKDERASRKAKANEVAKKAKDTIRWADQKKPDTGSEIAVRADAPVSPFVNYKRPVASPTMVVEVPTETETGVIMPPLPKHVCEPPKAIKTVEGKWGDAYSNDKHDEVIYKDGSVFECLCGQNWFVRVQKVPMHISSYDPQYIFGWKPVRWYNFARRMDIRNRKEQ